MSQLAQLGQWQGHTQGECRNFPALQGRQTQAVLGPQDKLPTESPLVTRSFIF